MKILAISDIESPYFWDYYEKKSWQTSTLSCLREIFVQSIFPSWSPCPTLRFCTYTATMIHNTNISRRKAVSVWMTNYMFTKAYVFWGWEDL